MAWTETMVLMTRVLINDLQEYLDPNGGVDDLYSDDRIITVMLVAARLVQTDMSISSYAVDFALKTISPDPTLDITNKTDNIFTMLTTLKTACLIDQGTFRTKAVAEGIKTALGPAVLNVVGNLKGYETLLDKGPCSLYNETLRDHLFGNGDIVQAILSPFVGNKFDPRYLVRGSMRSTDGSDFYS